MLIRKTTNYPKTAKYDILTIRWYKGTQRTQKLQFETFDIQVGNYSSFTLRVPVK